MERDCRVGDVACVGRSVADVHLVELQLVQPWISLEMTAPV